MEIQCLCCIYLSVKVHHFPHGQDFPHAVYIHTYSPANKSWSLCWIFAEKPLTENMFSLNGCCVHCCQCARKQISGGFSCCLGHEKIYKQSWETWSGRSPTLNPKNGQSKLGCLRPHCKPKNCPHDKTLLFLIRVCINLFKMSGGLAYLCVEGQKLQEGSQKGQDLLPGLFIYICNYMSIDGVYP